jgi:hypothetical protein
MTIRSFPRPPILSAATLLLISLIPILILTTAESLAQQPAPSLRRIFRSWPRAVAGGDDNGDDVKGGGAFDHLERIVRAVTRNDEYKFGDITKSVVGATTQGVEGTVRSVTRNRDYQFGDLTKKVAGLTTHGVEGRCTSASSHLLHVTPDSGAGQYLPTSPFTRSIRHREISDGERGL